ncbi:hypothetical protein FXO37_36108 [Capsicum annuum]|nr:hypothetical protein FXO37_36108 [Capsicum annuum]
MMNWEEVGSEKSKKLGRKVGSRGRAQEPVEISEEAIAAITKNSFDELMEEEEEQLVSTGKSKPKGNNKKENVTDDEDSKSQDEWANRTSSEEEDTSKESSGEEGDIPDKEKLCTNIGRKDNSETVKDKGKQAILRQTLKYKSEQVVTGIHNTRSKNGISRKKNSK